MFRALLAAVLLLNAAVPSTAAVNAAPVDAGQSQHAGHDMADMSLDGDSFGHPASDCCDDGSMDCRCGCVVSQPGAPQFVWAMRVYDKAPQPVVVAVTHHPAQPTASPFRPPA